RDEVAGLDLGHAVADLEDLAEALVTDDQVLTARGRVAVEGLVDLAVGRVHADLQDLDQDPAALGDLDDVRVRLVGQARGRDVPQVDAVRLAGQDGDGFHRCQLLRPVGCDEPDLATPYRPGTSTATGRAAAKMPRTHSLPNTSAGSVCFWIAANSARPG